MEDLNNTRTTNKTDIGEYGFTCMAGGPFNPRPAEADLFFVMFTYN
jgi:hypothetical protein